MDKIEKALAKLTAKEREKIRSILEKISAGDLTVLDVKKLKGREDIFRVRKGALRIIYRILENSDIVILEITRRSDTTYR